MASIRQLSNTKWQAQIRRAGHKPITNTFVTKSDAMMWARDIESKIDRGIFLDRTEAEKTSIAQLIERYLKDVTPLKKSGLREKSRLDLLEKHFGFLMATQLQSKQVAEFRDFRLSQGKAGATVIKELNTLSHVVDVAIKDWGLALVANPVKLIRKPKTANGRNRRLSSEEEKQLLQACRACRTQMLEPIVVFAIETGMRLSEMIRLEYQDIDFKLRVARLYETKNGETRDVPLSNKAIKAVLNMPRSISERRVFWAWRRADSIQHTWRRAVHRAGLVDFHFHDLRHEATSRFFELWTSPISVDI
jgi:integrase